MEYKVEYRIKNKMNSPDLSCTALDGEIGLRFDKFIYERVSGKFAIDEILREAEELIADQYDDEYCYGMWRCEFWGKLIISAARVCRMKKDDTLREDIRRSVYKVLQCQRADGYLSAYRDSDSIFRVSEERSLRETGKAVYYNWNIWGQKYTMWGLIECAMLLNDHHILTCAARMADHMLEQFDSLGVRVKDAGVMDGMPPCSVLKPMLILYRLTGEQKYYDFCMAIVKEWEREDNERPNLIKNALSNTPVALWYRDEDGWYAKAYEMTSCFDGICELYRISGDEKYLKAAECFWQELHDDELNILGSVGYCERYARGAKYADSATEICDVLHWMRLSYELFAITGGIKYMDAFEKAFLNAYLAGVFEDGKWGAFFIRASGRHWSADRQVETKYQHCCVNQVPRGFANTAESIMTMCGDDYYINLYLQSRIRFGNTTFRISAGYTDYGKVLITVRGAEVGSKLYLRIPEWSANTEVIVGETSIKAEHGKYVCVELTKTDMIVRVVFDMTPEVIDLKDRFTELDADDYHVRRWIDERNGLCDRSMMLKHPMSIVRCGPVMLARSKRFGSGDEMFSGETVSGKTCECSVQPIRHDRLLCGYRVEIRTEEKTYNYIMCDFASAGNRDSEDVKFFTIYV